MSFHKRFVFSSFLIITLLLLSCKALTLPVVTLPVVTLPSEAVTPPAQKAVLTPPPGGTPTTGSETSTPPAVTSPAPLPPTVGVAGARSIGDPYAPELGNGGYDVTRYTIRMALDPTQTEILSAVVTVDANSLLADLGQLSLDFVGFSIDRLSVDGQPAAYSREERKLVVNLPTPLAKDQAFSIEVGYHGRPTFERSKYIPFEDHQGLRFYPNLPALYVVSEPDGSRYWFPCNDHPRDKAAFRFELAVPENMTAVANGDLLKTSTEVPNALPDGRAGDIYTWEEKAPMATYLATVAVGKYVRVDGKSPKGIPLRSYVLAGDRSAFLKLQPTIGQAIDWMSAQFSPYPFGAFGYVKVTGLSGALECQTMVVTGSFDEETLVHEMAHMWFGDQVSLDSWSEIWRNEGFATYISAMWLSRNDPAGMDPYAARWLQAFNGKLPAPIDDPAPDEMFSDVSYYGGALLVHHLRLEVGDAAFFKGLKLYLQRYGGSSATTRDFIQAMQEASGKDLSAFFNVWLKEGFE